MAAINTRGVCKDCWDKDDELYDKARSSMKFGEKFIPAVLAQKTGVDIAHIQRWASLGRFGN